MIIDRDQDPDVTRPLSELRDSGLLWLINRVLFHPRGFAFALHVDDCGVATDWSLQGDGSEPWTFPPEQEPELFARAEETLRAAAARARRLDRARGDQRNGATT